MNMLNPTAIKNPKDYGPEDIDGLFIRRFKKDVKDQVAGSFPERVVRTPSTDATGKEEAVFAETVEKLTQKLSAARDEFRQRTEPQLAKLRAFLDTRTEQLELEFEQAIGKGLSSTRDYRRRKKEREARKKHDDYRDWITETMKTEDAPSIRLFAVFGNFSASD